MFRSRGRIPVMAGPRLIEMADEPRLRVILRAPNAVPILKHKRTLVEVQLLDYADCTRLRERWGNPQKYSTLPPPTEDAPVRTWKFKGIAAP